MYECTYIRHTYIHLCMHMCAFVCVCVTRYIRVCECAQCEAYECMAVCMAGSLCIYLNIVDLFMCVRAYIPGDILCINYN